MTNEDYRHHEKLGDAYRSEGAFDLADAAYARALELRPDASWIAHKRARLGPLPDLGDPLARITLFVPYYTPRDPERAEELRRCLDMNLDSGLFSRVVLLVDDETVPHRDDGVLQLIRLGKRPGYLDWVLAAERLCPGQIALLANSDIYFDSTITGLCTIFRQDLNAFVALSRFDRQGEEEVPHPNPHWSQDSWAFVPSADTADRLSRRVDIPLGVPRCDNRIAYVFATEGYTVYNPFPFIRSVHLHETGLRYYSKKGDRNLIGGMAMVKPGADLTMPARLSIELWSERSDQIDEFKVNRTLEKWSKEEVLRRKPRPAWLAHDADWQYPAITEQHAFERMRALLPGQPELYETVYLGFPFATLIDFLAQLGPDHPKTRVMLAALDSMREPLSAYDRVVTVAQHIRSRQFGQVFARAGVTDLFWSHMTDDGGPFEAAPAMRLHPFPLYPVQQLRRGADDLDRPRKWLFSFVGARAQKNYLTQVRTYIIEQLANHPRGRVIDRESWHYERVVYHKQVLDRRLEGALVDDRTSSDFKEMMDQSVFTLCPSGSGPNSIRLWEAIINGSIPVILADGWSAPGDPDLWNAATLRVPETPAAVADLPRLLETIAGDQARLRAMRKGLLQLALRYGPDGFVGDVHRLVTGADMSNVPSLPSVVLDSSAA